MKYHFSSFAEHASGEPGIFRLMVDLDQALNRPGRIHMLGGGNPGIVPEMLAYYRTAMASTIENDARFASIVGNYDGPAGNLDFRRTLARTLQSLYGWEVSESNVLLTDGSQNAFFLLLNLFSGSFPDGSHRRILFVQSPEYIGYENAGLHNDALTACPSRMVPLEDGFFRYAIDFDQLSSMLTDNSVGAMCVSRPTNPTGGMLEDEEMVRLGQLARDRRIPLIVDGAYGEPFPGIVYGEARPFFDDNTIFVLSLSKAGLPALRTGIVIGPTSILTLLERMQAIQHLAPGSIGPALLQQGLADGSFLSICRQSIPAFYRKRRDIALATLFEGLIPGKQVLIHRPDGAFFLWAIFPEMRCTSRQLYDKLKARGVIVVSGDYYYPGLDINIPLTAPAFSHKAVRISYSQEPSAIREGLQILCEVVRDESKPADKQ